MACHVAEGLPVVFHIAQHATDYSIAIESNIRAGGDNCGRSIMLGAMVAADMANRRIPDFPFRYRGWHGIENLWLQQTHAPHFNIYMHAS